MKFPIQDFDYKLSSCSDFGWTATEAADTSHDDSTVGLVSCRDATGCVCVRCELMWMTQVEHIKTLVCLRDKCSQRDVSRIL
jgi:hypothetical protein